MFYLSIYLSIYLFYLFILFDFTYVQPWTLERYPDQILSTDRQTDKQTDKPIHKPVYGVASQLKIICTYGVWAVSGAAVCTHVLYNGLYNCLGSSQA